MYTHGKERQRNRRIKGHNAGAPLQATDNSNVGADRCVCPKEIPPKNNLGCAFAQPRYVIYKVRCLLFCNKLAFGEFVYARQSVCKLSCILLRSLSHKFFTILNVDATLNGLCYLAALEVVNSSVGSFAIGCDRVDACYATCYGDPACVVGKFLF